MSRNASLFLMLVTSLAFGQPILAAAADATGEQRLPELVRTSHRVFAIPFRLPEARDADATPRRVVMSVSADLGVSWQPAGEVAPTAGSLTYRAEKDGEYWFQIRVIDSKGRARGGAGPDVRVLVDAAGPRIAARVWRGADGEIICRYAATDDSLRMDSLRIEYRTGGDPAWKSLAAEGILSRETPAHMVGEDIWWAGEKVESLTVRIAITDAAGNQAVKQFSLDRSDPGIDQAALARELGVPPLPTRETPVDERSGGLGHTAATAARPDTRFLPSSETAWAPEMASGWPGGTSISENERRTSAPGEPQHRFVSRDPSAITTADSLTAAAASAATTMQYRGRPLQVSRSRRFSWDYEIDAASAAGRPLRVELWSTRDSGVTWQRVGVDTDGRSPIDVSLSAAGLYGFRLVIVPDVPGTERGPRTGEAPETWVAVDDEPPQVKVEEAGAATDQQPGCILIRYSSHDQLPAPRGVRLSFSPHADGPWSTIADELEPEGTHRWQPDGTVPPSVYIRAEARDVAGNVGVAVTSAPIMLSTGQVVGRLGGLRELPTAPAGQDR